jgi:peptidyl-tRNA hydrolase, PTH1 family
MKLIVGLGNPGRRYSETRHNMGYRTVDRLARQWNIDVSREKFSGLVGNGRYADQEVMLLKPTTFMNLSGEAVLAACQFYKVPLSDLMVVLDDLDLPTGRIRVRSAGSAGGHKGLSDIARRLGNQEFGRIRIGIGRTERDGVVDYVLSRADEDEAPLLEQAITLAAEAVATWVRQGIETCMNRFNGPSAPSAHHEQRSRRTPPTDGRSEER